MSDSFSEFEAMTRRTIARAFNVPEHLLRDTVQRPPTLTFDDLVAIRDSLARHYHASANVAELRRNWITCNDATPWHGAAHGTGWIGPDPEPVRADSFDEWQKKTAKVLGECGRRGL